MTCPICGGDTKVIDCKAECDNVWRRRKCLDCNYRFNTIETDADLLERLVKNNEKITTDAPKGGDAQ